MTRVRILIAALVGVLALAACADTPDSVDEAISTLPDQGDISDAVTDLQDEIDAVATAVQNSEAADDLQAGWAELQGEINSTVNAIASNETVDTDSIRAELDEFQTALEAAGDDVGDELIAAWNELRARVEQLIG